MTAAQLGHRAASQGDYKNPFDFKTQPEEHDAWIDAAKVVDAHRANGLDPAGHQPPPPHVCTRDQMKVCNCCSRCTTECWSEGLPALPTVKSLLKKLKEKILG